MSDGTFRGRWVDEVFRSPLITDAVRVALLALVPDMDEAGQVSISREEIARRIGKGKARVTERLNAAIGARLLERTIEGKKGQVAEYAARLPKGSANPDPIQAQGETPKGPLVRTESEHFGSGLQTQTREKGSGLQTQSEATERDSGPLDRTPSADKGSANPDPLYRDGVDVSSEVEEINTDDALFKEPAASQRSTKPKIVRKRSTEPKTTIPEDFAITPDMREWAKRRVPEVDIDLETEIFVNHFLDKRVKRPGWRRSWENWMLRAKSWNPKREGGSARGNVTPLRSTGTDGRYAPGSGAFIDPNQTYSDDPKDVFGS